MPTSRYHERVSAQPYHHGNLRSALLAEAERTIAADGVEGLSLRRLARDLGVSHGAPSRHFRDKQALLDALAYEGFVALNDAMTRAAAGPGTFRVRLERVARGYVSFAVERAALLTVMYATKHHPRASAELRQIGQASTAIATGLIRQAQQAGEVGPGAPDRLALVAFATVHGVATLATGELLDGVPVDDAVTAAVDVLWAGLGV